ncbi:MAG: hypothetical protein GX882_09960 [Methanomicrobiales archaeon]|nr:hypothetical protein [Methanomicrobiales archaeon]
MKRRTGMRVLSALFAVLPVRVGVVPVMACNPLEPGDCTSYSFTESSGAVDDSNIVVNSDELTGDTRNATVAQALSDTALSNACGMDCSVMDLFSLQSKFR